MKPRDCERQRTDESLLTPETQMSWDTRFAPKIRNEVAVEEVEVPLERLEIPCFMSGMRNRKIGSERKC